MFFPTVSNTEKSVEKQGDSRVFLTNLDVFWNRSQYLYTVGFETNQNSERAFITYKDTY